MKNLQLRLDFTTFMITGPSIDTNSVAKRKGNNPDVTKGVTG